MDAFWIGWIGGTLAGGVLGVAIKSTLDFNAQIKRERQEREKTEQDRRFQDLGRRIDTLEGRARGAS